MTARLRPTGPLQEFGFDVLGDLVRDLRGAGVLWMAEKVETDFELRRCRELGFDLFQGYAVGAPRMMSLPIRTESRLPSLAGSPSRLLRPVRRVPEPFRP